MAGLQMLGSSLTGERMKAMVLVNIVMLWCIKMMVKMNEMKRWSITLKL